MPIPGFTAETALHSASRRYPTRSISGRSATGVVVPARGGACGLGCYLACAGGFLGCGATCVAALVAAQDMTAPGALMAFALCLGAACGSSAAVCAYQCAPSCE
jgi:hypothetical protein